MLTFIAGMALGSMLAPQVRSAGKEIAALAARAWAKIN